MVELIRDSREKARIARRVLEALPEWFGIEASREAYIRESVDQPFFACYADGEAAGFLSLKETGRATAELAVMGVLPALHRRGLGRALLPGLFLQQGQRHLGVKAGGELGALYDRLIEDLGEQAERGQAQTFLPHHRHIRSCHRNLLDVVSHQQHPL